jgi:hypothetical protein
MADTKRVADVIVIIGATVASVLAAPAIAVLAVTCAIAERVEGMDEIQRGRRLFVSDVVLRAARRAASSWRGRRDVW